jgi:hypothetical protein
MVRGASRLFEREPEALTAEIAEDEWQQVEVWKEGSLPPILYLGLQGTGIPRRAEELQGRVAYRNAVAPSIHL